MVNRAIIVGRLGRLPETKFTAGGKAVCNFSVAVDEKYQGEKSVTWFRVVCFDKQAETAQRYLTTGSLVYIDGKIHPKEYTNRDGVKVKDLEIICNQFRMLGGGEKKMAVGETETAPVVSDEDIPF